jgi:N6-adenosine-specific RNA methylase IME4
MGIKGTVRRNQDAHVIHSNVDTDIIVAEEYPFGSTRKPDEMYSVIEHFCLVSEPGLPTARICWDCEGSRSSCMVHSVHSNLLQA